MLSKSGYKTLRNLLENESVKDEYSDTSRLIKSLRHVKREKVLTKPELISICRWKSPRAIHHIKANHGATVRSLTRKALSTRSERKKLDFLTRLRGVSLPMASAILTIIYPKRYGVIDIRIWKLLYAINSVGKNPKGVGFTFNHWYHYLSLLRFHAQEMNVTVRAVERTLFFYHRKIQEGVLYDST